ncbi:hypothetical protein TNCV_4083361 [Trichonephila clavipes]|nr:hypothetical protein TNCV_4083361 [Trichonephila clavipes]
MRIGDRWMQRKRRIHGADRSHLVAQLPLMTIVHMAVIDHAAKSRNIAQQIQSIAHHSVSALTIPPGVHCFVYSCLETTGVCATNGVINGRHGQRTCVRCFGDTPYGTIISSGEHPTTKTGIDLGMGTYTSRNAGHSGVEYEETRLDKGEGVTKLATEFNVGKASVGDINEWMEEDGETAEFLTDDDIAAAVTQLQ